LREAAREAWKQHCADQLQAEKDAQAEQERRREDARQNAIQQSQMVLAARNGAVDPLLVPSGPIPEDNPLLPFPPAPPQAAPGPFDTDEYLRQLARHVDEEWNELHAEEIEQMMQVLGERKRRRKPAAPPVVDRSASAGRAPLPILQRYEVRKWTELKLRSPTLPSSPGLPEFPIAYELTFILADIREKDNSCPSSLPIHG
jgi:hypothetical protein